MHPLYRVSAIFLHVVCPRFEPDVQRVKKARATTKTFLSVFCTIMMWHGIGLARGKALVAQTAFSHFSVIRSNS